MTQKHAANKCIAKSGADGILLVRRIICKLYIFNQLQECQDPAFGNTRTLPAMPKTISPTIKSLYLIANLNMTRQALIERTIKAINQLPDDKASEISDFIEFIIKRYEEDKLSEAIQHIAANGKTFDFLNDEEELYSEADLKEKYNG